MQGPRLPPHYVAKVMAKLSNTKPKGTSTSRKVRATREAARRHAPDLTVAVTIASPSDAPLRHFRVGKPASDSTRLPRATLERIAASLKAA